MKKALALFLALVMCLSFTACGGGNDTPTTGQNEQLENNTPSTQETPTETTVPETTVPETTAEPEPVYETIEITMDNWQEYLEIKIDPQKRQWYCNSFDETIQCLEYVCLMIKDEYLGLINENTIDIAVGYTSVNSFIEYDIDFKNKGITYGAVGIPDALKESGHLGGGNVSEKTTKMNSTSNQISELGFYDESICTTPLTEKLNDKTYIIYPIVTITRIQGTITIRTN